MNIDPKCCSCKKYIRNENILYMCVDNTFCSMLCRNKHLGYIKKFDPGLNYPDRWNINNTYSVKVDCLIELDYIHNLKSKSKHILYRSHSLTNLLEHEEKEKLIITCIKVRMFGFKLTDKRIKIFGMCLMIIIMSVTIKMMFLK